MKSRRGFIAMIAGALPAAAVAKVALGNQNRLSEPRQPKTVDFDIENSKTVSGIFANGPLGSQFVMSDPYYKSFDPVRWLPSNNKYPANPLRGDCFYHEARGKCYVFDGRGWFELCGAKEPETYVSNSGRIEWIIEGDRVVMTKMPWEYARKYLKGHLTGLKWHGFDGENPRKVWSCELTHANTVYLRNDCRHA